MLADETLQESCLWADMALTGVGSLEPAGVQAPICPGPEPDEFIVSFPNHDQVAGPHKYAK